MTTLGILLLAAGLLVVGALASWRMGSAVGELERAQYGRLATEVRGRVERLVSRDRSRLKEAAFSDELYALVQRGPAPPDSFVHPPFTEWFPRLYGDQFVGLYDLQGKRLFGWSDGEHALESIAVTNPLLRILDNREPAAGLLRNGDNLYWVAGVPILPTNYGDASQPIRGYLVVAQVFSGQPLASLVADRPVELILKSMVPPKTPFRSDVSATAKGDSAIVRFALADVFAQQNTLGELVTSRAEFRAVERSFHWAAIACTVLLFGLAAFAWWLAQRWVVEPAVRMTQALQPVHQGQIPPMVGAPVPANEWTAMTGSVNRLLANLRTGHERLDRFLGAVRDGAWEQDLNSGEWIMSSRFRELLGYSEAELPATLHAFEQLLHGDEREYVLVTLQASSGSARPVDLEVQLRQKTGEYGRYRLQAVVQTDHNGAPMRFTGRLVDLTPERAADLAVTTARTAAEQSRKAQGRLFATLGQQLARSAPERGNAVTTLGEAMAGTLGLRAEAFDLHQLIQDVASQVDVTAEVAVVPGVPTRVSGDADRVRQILTELVKNAARSTQDRRIVVRAEHPDGTAANVLRISVCDHGAALTSRDQQRLLAPLTTGDAPPDGNAGVGLPLVRELIRTLGGRAGAEFPPNGGAQVWFELTLPAVKEEYGATAAPDFGTEVPAFWSAPEADSTFPPPAQTKPERGTPARPERVSNPKFELVADETVVIDLDGPEPVKRSAESSAPALLTQLKAGGQAGRLAGQMATIFLKDAPIRLAELKGAVKAGEQPTVASIALSLKGMANLIGAAALVERCQALEDATSSGEHEHEGDLALRIERELDRIRPLLEPFGPPAAAPAPAAPPIDPATLEQIRASLSADSFGLGTQLVSLFLAEAPAKVDGLEQAARGGDADAVSGAADDLKGMCTLVGAHPLSECCSRVATGRRAGAVDAPIAALRAEYARVQQVLEELLGARTSA